MAVSSTIVLGLGAVAFIWVALLHLTRIKVDPREPPLIESKIPLMGHIIGMMRNGPMHIAKVRYASLGIISL